MIKGNLFRDLPQPTTGEAFERILSHRNLVVERIISSDRPEQTLYDQEQDEWVLLVEGQATLEIGGEPMDLGPGDHVFIPAHTPHRVLQTSNTPRCVWLAVHLYPVEAPD